MRQNCHTDKNNIHFISLRDNGHSHCGRYTGNLDTVTSSGLIVNYLQIKRVKYLEKSENFDIFDL